MKIGPTFQSALGLIHIIGTAVRRNLAIYLIRLLRSGRNEFILVFQQTSMLAISSYCRQYAGRFFFVSRRIARTFARSSVVTLANFGFPSLPVRTS